jgi:hypothetical protein
MKTATIIFSLAAMADASCPNACSGSGICGAQDKCSCYQNWQGADCSARTCPSTLAWADTADGTNQAHYYAECGNKGICDRKSGECKCFDGYEGKGCRRSTCPEGCSGHGTCEYIEELARDFVDRRNGPGNKYKDLTCTSQGGEVFGNNCLTYHATRGIQTGKPGLVTSNVVARSANTDHLSGLQYNLWDAGKIQGCKCDLGYKGADCSTREVPRGDDPLTTVKFDTMKQKIWLVGVASGDEFFLNYYDPYGGKWTTNTIHSLAPSNTHTQNSDTIVAADVQEQLQALPNEVLEGVKVKATKANGDLFSNQFGLNAASNLQCIRFYDGVQHISAYSETTDGSFKDSAGSTNFCKHTEERGALSASGISLTVEFAASPGQTGVQYLLEVDGYPSEAGSFPVSQGIGSIASGNKEYVTVVEINYNDNLGNLSELSGCSDRGLDNGDGECECFDGFRGLACEEQEALV